MAHGFFDWGADLELQDARETRSAYQTLDGGIIWKVVEAVWNGDATMEDALKTAHVSKGSAIQVYKVQDGEDTFVVLSKLTTKFKDDVIGTGHAHSLSILYALNYM